MQGFISKEKDIICCIRPRPSQVYDLKRSEAFVILQIWHWEFCAGVIKEFSRISPSFLICYLTPSPEELISRTLLHLLHPGLILIFVFSGKLNLQKLYKYICDIFITSPPCYPTFLRFPLPSNQFILDNLLFIYMDMTKFSLQMK